MKSLPWIIAAAAVGAAAYILYNTPGPQAATGSDSVEGAARSSSQWGSKTRVGGTGDSVIGKVKESLGNLTGNDNLAAEGVGDQASGALKDTAGKFAQAAGQTIHDLNR